MLNDVQTSYMYNAEPYVGKIATSITADNWFMSVPLVQKMQEKNLTMVGTLRKNKLLRLLVLYHQ